MKNPTRTGCSCGDELLPLMTRRDFLKTTATKGAVLATAATSVSLQKAIAHPPPKDTSETLAAQLYRSITEEQRTSLCFDFSDPLRHKVDNNCG